MRLQKVTQNKVRSWDMKAIVLKILTAATLVLATAAGTMAQTSWNCGYNGANVKATLDEEGTLTISGTGAMADYLYATNSPWYNSRKSITGVVIEDGVTFIGVYTFYDCTNLTSVTIPNSVTSIGHYAFYGCTGLMSIEVGVGNTAYISVDGVLFNKNKTTLIQYPASKQGTTYIIPNSVTYVGYGAFKNCAGLVCVTIPNSVTSIGGGYNAGAFSGCTGLTSVTIPNSVTSIEIYAFSNCTGLTSVTIPNSVTSIRWGTFSNCTGLTSVTIPNSVTSIGDNAFSGCTGLTSVTISDNVTSIRYGAFADCRNLASITIPNGVTSIGDGAFIRCSGLTSVTIPNSVTSIGKSAFYGCVGLPSVTIGSGVRSIGKEAFRSCVGLTSITSLKAVPPGIDTTTFADVPLDSVCLFVPQTAINAYNSADVWKDFSCIQAITDKLNKITFDSRGGGSVSAQYVFSGSTAAVPEDPIRPDSLFGGWYKNAACTVPWDFADAVASDMTLYAVYIPKEYVPVVEAPKANAPMMKEGAAIPVNQPAGEFTAGPNPVSKQTGNINFYRHGKQAANSELRIYDITGNIINKVKISDMAVDNQLKRKVGSWDLRDSKGRPVPAGTYLVRGMVNTSDGRKEKVSLIIGVR
jgi:hypothetical protein